MKLAGGGVPTTPTPTEVLLPTDIIEEVEVIASESAVADISTGIQWGTVAYWVALFLIILAGVILVKRLIKWWRK